MGHLNYKIEIEYDGTNFRGWQLQPDDRTVQGVLEGALQPLGAGRRITVNGAGRTDSGVHARGQVANFILETTMDVERLKAAINGRLPEDVQVNNIAIVDEDFHARFSARKREYSYTLTAESVVLGRQYSWAVKHKFDGNLLDRCAELLLGEHDFSGFCKANIETDTTICRIEKSYWQSDGDYLVFRIVGNRFLHHMVRFIVGTSMDVARGRYGFSDFENQLNEPGGSLSPYCAPSTGLVLEKIDY